MNAASNETVNPLSGIELLNTIYKPDVLQCLANLSNDEVFTPPDVVNEILDMLPHELFSNPETRFLDPVSKSGVFLREIAKRLLEGLKDQIPDLQTRLDHIFHKQLFGIAITELTALMSRRSVYCSKNANSKWSVSTFETPEGNIAFTRIKHTWENGKCKYCGASKSEYDRSGDLETHAYQFIHPGKKAFEDMKFDVIVGNPPYQLSDGGGGGSASPIYNKFVEQAKKLKPRYLSMIIPSRWFSGGRGLDDFRDNMLNDKHLRKIVDFPASSDCFPGVEIKGGVCYFLWDRENAGLCEITTVTNGVTSTMKRSTLEEGTSTFIRYNEAVSIYRKVISKKERSFADIVSSSKPFGLRTYVVAEKTASAGSYKLYANKDVGYISKNSITVGKHLIDKHKVYITYAYGAGEDFPHQIINKPFYGEPGSVCTETYLVIGPFDTKDETLNAISYLKTKFLRFMVLLLKSTQHATKTVYQFVPMQDFTKAWTDVELYDKYGLTKEEISFIDSMVRPME